MLKKARMIGIVGGMGPCAGLDFARKLLSHTPARRDQDHLPLAILSCPSEIADRSAFLLGHSAENPGFAIAGIILKLEAMGAELIGIPCNTSHSPAIYNVILEELARHKSKAELFDMVQETVAFAKASGIRRPGLMATAGTYASGVYEKAFADAGLESVIPGKAWQDAIHDSIYNPAYGLKVQAFPPSEEARGHLLSALRHLKEKGADSILLGCTELSLSISEESTDLPLLDASDILARALLRKSLPDPLGAEPMLRDAKA